jgi:hypothetical protein
MMETKYKVGDLLLIKDIRLRPPLRPPVRLRPRPPLPLRLHNTVGIITEVHKHSDVFRSGSTENDNGYVWYSQVDGREYWFYEDEAECGVLK